jgi:hypothetical protein
VEMTARPDNPPPIAPDSACGGSRRTALRGWMFVLLMAMVWALASGTARAADLPILDVAAVPYLKPEGRAKYERFLLINLPRAFALSSNGATGWWGGGGTLEQARAKALATCATNGATDCAIYAEDLVVVLPDRPHLDPPAVPGPLITGSGYAFVPDPRFIWHGPQAARGLCVWGHGKSAGQQDLSGDQPQSYVRVFNDAGFDVVRFARAPAGDYTDSAEGWLRQALPKLRALGWRTLVVGGQSRGGWNSLQMLDTPGLADAVIAVSPASLNSNLPSAQAAEVYRITHAANAPTTRVAIAQFKGDAFVPTGMDDRVASLRTGLTGRVAALLLIDQPSGLTGHGAGNSVDFAERFGRCLLRFVLDPTPPASCAGETP